MPKIMGWAWATLLCLAGCQPMQLSHQPQIINWPASAHPYAPSGFRVSCFATGLQRPCNLLVTENGDVFVAESHRITLLRDANGDGNPELRTVFLDGLYRPYGMAITDEHFLVADSDAIYSYQYRIGSLKPAQIGKQVLQLPAGKNDRHWQRNLLFSKVDQKVYVTVGSATETGERGMRQEYRRADILELDLRKGTERTYASGLHNPLGLDWATSGKLWAIVAEGNGASDYLTSIQDGGFYGWPYINSNQALQDGGFNPASKALAPELSLSPASGTQGLTFYRAHNFPSHYRNGAFISQHGTDARSNLNGFKVVFVPFETGFPSGPAEDFLTGFVPDYNRNQVYGRPTAVAVAWDGALLVADDGGNRIWRVSR